MKTTVNFYQFVEAFRAAGRENQVSYEAKRAIFDYIEQYEQDSGEEIELDVVGLCCDWNEATWQEIADDYEIDLTECSDDDEKIQAVEEHLEYHTQFVNMGEGNFIYVAF